MAYILQGIIICSFIALFAVNVVFRVRLMKMFKQMSKLNISFSVQHLFNKKRLIDEVVQFNLPHEELIMNLWHTLRKAIIFAITLLLTIVICSIVLNQINS